MIFIFHFFTSINIYIAVRLQKWLSGKCENFKIRRVHISNNKVEKQHACSCVCNINICYIRRLAFSLFDVEQTYTQIRSHSFTQLLV